MKLVGNVLTNCSVGVYAGKSGADDDTAVFLEGNRLTGNTEAGLIVSGGARADAGDCAGANVTGFGSSAGGNDLSGYGFDGAAPWAIENLNPNGQPVLAGNDQFGAAAANDIRLLLKQVSPVRFAQSGGLLVKPPDAISVQCPSEVPHPATNAANFLAQPGAVISSSDVTVQVTDNPPTYPFEGNVTRTFAFLDVCGQVAACQQVIHIEDTGPPAVICPPDAVVGTAPGPGSLGYWVCHGGG